MDALHAIYDTFSDRVAFFVVYIKEAHPEDGWVLTENRSEEISISDPKTDAERAEAADACVVRSSIRIPTLVDGMDDATALAYGAWPDRLYLIATDGTIAFQGDVGPFGFLPDKLEEAIVSALSG